MSKVPAHFELIPAIKQLRDQIAPQTLLTINGDIRDRAHGEELVKEYGVDGIMIGRGVFHDPFAFSKAQPLATSFLEISAAPIEPDGGSSEIGCEAVSEKDGGEKAKLLDLFKLHLDLFDRYSAELEPRKFDPLKRFFKIYVREFPGASDLREQLMHTKSTNQVREILAGYK